MTRIGTLQGTYLGIYHAKVCEYWTARPQKVNCKFCSVGLNLGVDDADVERGLPIGCAPNVHVSLVMLPEEGRALSPRRFPLGGTKLALMAKAFGYQFRRRTARAASEGRVAPVPAP